VILARLYERSAPRSSPKNRKGLVMAKPVSPIPPGYSSVTPYLIIRGAAEAIEFYKKAFGAEECFRFTAPDGRSIGHAEIKIGNSTLMLADECPEWDAKSPQTLAGTPVSFAFYVPDVDAAFARAVKAGAKVVRPIEDKFY